MPSSAGSCPMRMTATAPRLRGSLCWWRRCRCGGGGPSLSVRRPRKLALRLRPPAWPYRFSATSCAPCGAVGAGGPWGETFGRRGPRHFARSRHLLWSLRAAPHAGAACGGISAMNQAHDEIDFLLLPLVLLAAAVVSVPIARLLRLSPIVAYLTAGVVIG